MPCWPPSGRMRVSSANCNKRTDASEPDTRLGGLFCSNGTPSGVDFEAARELGLNVIHALALPGKVAPVTAAKAIKETIYNMLREAGRLGPGKEGPL